MIKYNLGIYKQLLRNNKAKEYRLINSVHRLMSEQSEEIMGKNYMKFKAKYEQHQQDFKQKMDNLEKEQSKKIQSTRNQQIGYEHPYHSDHHPLNFSGVKNSEFLFDLVGPEQVSPHYENFMVSRKYAISFVATMGVLSFAVGTYDLHWVLKSCYIPIITWVACLYIVIEGRKSWFKPLLQRFYRRVAANECYNIESYYHENMQYQINKLIKDGFQQLDYWESHQDYQQIKAESIASFLVNEHNNLQKHIADRAVNVLQQVENYEQMNTNKYLNSIVEEALVELDQALKGKDSQAIQDQMMKVAIEGLSLGYCNYANDPIMPLVRNVIKNRVEKVQAMTPEQQSVLTQLKADQVKSVRDQDQRAKEEFLKQQPLIDNSLKNNETVKKILATWGHQ